MVGAERVEHRAVAAGDRRERRLVHRREVVVLGERVDRQLPVDRTSPAPSRPAATTGRCPTSRVLRPAAPGMRGCPASRRDRATSTGNPRIRSPAIRSTLGLPADLSGKPFLARHADQVAVEVIIPRVVRAHAAGGRTPHPSAICDCRCRQTLSNALPIRRMCGSAGWTGPLPSWCSTRRACGNSET